MSRRQHLRPWLRHYAAQQILADLTRWRSERDRRTCEALWNLPARQTRKENDR
ncbi:hypothetical protein ABGT92_23610 [Streptomyces cinereoruber]|uniref:hypothetical protein n=1 Tax=Streptomyces cinereoruber TaxID=67260 RepID=UPI00345D3F5E